MDTRLRQLILMRQLALVPFEMSIVDRKVDDAAGFCLVDHKPVSLATCRLKIPQNCNVWQFFLAQLSRMKRFPRYVDDVCGIGNAEPLPKAASVGLSALEMFFVPGVAGDTSDLTISYVAEPTKFKSTTRFLLASSISFACK